MEKFIQIFTIIKYQKRALSVFLYQYYWLNIRKTFFWENIRNFLIWIESGPGGPLNLLLSYDAKLSLTRELVTKIATSVKRNGNFEGT